MCNPALGGCLECSCGLQGMEMLQWAEHGRAKMVYKYGEIWKDGYID